MKRLAFFVMLLASSPLLAKPAPALPSEIDEEDAARGKALLAKRMEIEAEFELFNLGIRKKYGVTRDDQIDVHTRKINRAKAAK